MAEFYRKVNEEKSYHRAIFLAAALALAGICSVYPTACFKKYSSKERAKLKEGVEELDRKKDELLGRHRHHSRPRSESPSRVAAHHQHRRRHSAAVPNRYRTPSNRYNRELRRTQQEIEMDRSPRPYHRASNDDRGQDRDRQEKHGGFRPARREHKSSWEDVLKPVPA